MCMSDWSSEVCSSDLHPRALVRPKDRGEVLQVPVEEVERRPFLPADPDAGFGKFINRDAEGAERLRRHRPADAHAVAPACEHEVDVLGEKYLQVRITRLKRSQGCD